MSSSDSASRPTTSESLQRVKKALEPVYRVERELGRGGWSIVYKAREDKHDRTVAIKVLRDELSAAVGAERFLQEIRIVSQLQHPNIVPLFESGQRDGLVYYVMPCIDGHSLRTRLEQEQQLSLDDATQIAIEIADALAYAHSQGVIHRDIKPENVLLSGEHAMVADFGIAHAVNEAGGEELTASGMAIGTPLYMSPEQGSGDIHIDGRSDIYSLACVLYEMLAGDPPFTAKTPQAIFAKHRHETLPSLAVVRPSLPQEFVETIEMALEKVPADRFKTAEQFRDSLQGTARLPRRRRIHKFLLRQRIAIAALATVVLVALVLKSIIGSSGLPQLDRHRVVVYPLASTAAAEQGAGERVALMIGRALEQTEPLRFMDGWTFLTPAQRENVATLSVDSARQISIERGAGYFIDGRIAAEPDSNTVMVRLYDVAADSTVTSASAAAVHGDMSLPRLGTQAVVHLLPFIVGSDRAVGDSELRAITERHPAAVANWLQGEQQYRRSRFDSALVHFDRAIAADSQLGLAALKGALAAGWAGRDDRTEELASLAVEHVELFPAKYGPLARGLLARFRGNADSAIVYAREAIDLDSEWSDAWMLLGEARIHLVSTPDVDAQYLTQIPPPLDWPLDSLAKLAFTTTLRYDPGYTPAFTHLAEIAMRQRDFEAARHFLRRSEEIAPESARTQRLRLMMTCLEDGVDAVRWNSETADDLAPVLATGFILTRGAHHVPCATRAFRAVLDAPAATPGDRWGALFGLQSLMVTAGRTEAAEALVDSAAQAGIGAASALYVIDAVAGAPMEDRATSFVEQFGSDYAQRSTPSLWLLGTWASHSGDVENLSLIAGALEDKASESGARMDRLMLDVINARLAVARGDTTDAIARLERLVPTARYRDLAWSMWEPVAAERLLLAKLLLAREEYVRAHQIASFFDYGEAVAYSLHVAASLEIRIAAATALGREELAGKHRARLNLLRSN